MELHTLGIDLGKAVFHTVGLNKRGDVVMRKKFSRSQLLRFTRLQTHAGHSRSRSRDRYGDRGSDRQWMRFWKRA